MGKEQVLALKNYCSSRRPSFTCIIIVTYRESLLQFLETVETSVRGLGELRLLDFDSTDQKKKLKSVLVL
jgi:hypothetical protein